MGLQLVELEAGFPCHVSGEFEARFIYQEIFQDNNYDPDGLPESPFIIDVGANIGLFSLYMKRHHPAARILAYEPAPENVEALRKNLELHEVEGVTVYPCCLGTEPTDAARFTYYPQMPGNSTLHPDGKALQKRLMTERLGAEQATELFEATEITVPVRRLSGVLADDHPDVDTIDLLKVDVEGAELDVLGGIDDADWPRIRTVMLEVADFDGKLAEVERLLTRHGLVVSSAPVAFMWDELRFFYVTAARP